MITVKLMTGTNIKNGKDILKGHFNDLSWWSDNLETVAHYYEGMVIEIEIKLDKQQETEYVASVGELNDIGSTLKKYKYGSCEVTYPKGATWYSFSSDYLKYNSSSIKEIFPDLSEWNEEDL